MAKEERTQKIDHAERVAEFLLRRLREVGLADIFGVAGDYNLELLEQIENTEGLRWLGCCNELNAAYAADGYARTHGLSALITTYGVGELSALCGVAGAYSEHVPVISIVGAAPLGEIERKGLLHHTAGDGDYVNMMTCGRQFSVAQARLTPQNAVAEIDRCLQTCILHKKPVYLQLPSDIAHLNIATPRERLRVDFQSDPQMLNQFVAEAIQRIAAASSIAILVDADVARHRQAEGVRELAAKLSCPIAVMGTAKGVIDETDPAYIGVYSGAFSKPEVRNTIENAECLIQFAVRFIDSTTASFSQQIHPQHSISIGAWGGEIDGDDYQGICMRDVITTLLASVASRSSEFPIKHKNTSAADPVKQLTQAWFWKNMEQFLQERDVVITENGTSLNGIMGMPLPAGTDVIYQALWGSIGYSLPATFGSLVAAPDRRHVLFIGDGSFQLAAQELSSILRHKLKPIIFLINNDGYTIERLILGENSSYNDIQPWKYAALCDVFAAGAPFESRCVTTVGEAEDALQQAAKGDKCFFIEIMMPRMDAPDSLKKLGPVYARQDYGKSWEQRTTHKQMHTDPSSPYDLNSPIREVT